MADIIEINYSIDKSNELGKTVTKIDRLEAKTRKLAQAVSDGVVTENRRKATLIALGRELKGLTDLTGTQAYGAVVKYLNAQIKATDAEKQAAATKKKLAAEQKIKSQQDRQEAADRKKAEADLKREKQAFENLRRSVDPVYAAKQRTIKVTQQLRAAVDREEISVQEAAKTLRLYRQELKLTNASQMAATKASNRLGVVTQQAGYQVSDFIVQVQGGTNPFTAFSMQATQLVGVLPLVAGRLGMTTNAAIALSASLGIAIPIVGLIGASLLTMSGSSKDAENSFDSLNAAIDDYISLTEQLQDGGGLSEEFGYLADEAERVLNNLRQISQVKINKEISELFGGEVESTQRLVPNKGYVETFDPAQTKKAAGLLGVGRTTDEDISKIREFLGLLREVQQAENLDARIAAASELSQFIGENTDKTKLNVEQLEEIEGLEESLLQLIKMRATETGVLNDATRESAEALQELLDAGKKANLERNRESYKTILGLKQEVALAEKGLEYGEESLEFIREKAKQEAIALNLTSTATKKYIDLQEKLFELEQGKKNKEDLEEQALGVDKLKAKYQALTEAQMGDAEGVKEATRRAREEIELTNAVRSLGLKVLGQEHLELIKMLRTYQAERKSVEDTLAAKELSLKASKALQTAEDKVAQEQIKTLKAQGDITKARELEVNLAKRMAYEKVLSLAKTEEEKQELMASAIEAAVLAEELVKAGHATEDAKDEAKGLADALKDAERAMSSLTSFGDGLEKKLAQAKAEAVALKLGLDVGTAKDVAGLRFEAAKEYEGAFTTATDSAGQVSAALEYGRALELINELEEAGYDNAAKRDSQKDKNIKSTQDEIDKLMEAIRVEQTRLNLGEEEARQLEILQDLRRFNADADIKLTEKEMKAAAAKIAQMEQENQKLEEQKQKYEELGDSIADHFGDAIMSIVDGTETMEDAFRKMAAEIVQELFRVLVLQQAIASFKAAGKVLGIPFFEDGAAFSNGRVTPFANGGVVASPTYFPMAGGNTGLMGEAGPEAIMPLKRGKDGKLGVQAEGGGNVVVNQTINVSTGVQQTVRTEIKSLMPQIADSAKNAVLDSKRRGGSYGRNF